MPVDSGHLFDELMKRYDDLTRDYFVSEIRAGIVSGEGTKEMVHRLSGDTSLLSIQAASAERMVRSVVMHTMNTARLELYKANRDVIKAVQYVATLDTKTCPVCGTLDGKVWDLDEQHPNPPMHYNCRCVLAPITKSWRELGIDKDEVPPSVRSSMNGYIPETMDYKEWLAKQSEKTQAEILGPTRLKLYKQGLSIEKMVRNGKPLTIEELRQKELFD
jgi:SPP1 gp7 family putative phage head morphogenesis protein